MSIKRIAINTGGGDAPGLNAVIRAAVLSACTRGWECVGVRDAFNGLMIPHEYPEGWLMPLTRESVRGITHLGGTIIGTSNRGNPRKFPVENENGEIIRVDRTDEIVSAFESQGIDALIAIGGDGGLKLAHTLSQRGIQVVGVPKTIDNDLDQTVITFGFDTAVHFATECLDRLHSTAAAHQRVIVVEVMGRYAGWIALNAGVAGTADAVLIPEIPYDINKVAEAVLDREKRGRRFSLVVVAEGAKPNGGTVATMNPNSDRLGGIGYIVGAQLEELTGKQTRVVRLGHLLRGGTPTSFDRLLSLRFGAAAVRALDEGHSGVMVALDPPTVRYVPLEQATHRMKTVPLTADTVLTARDLGISFGD
ncbi:MAG: ATP-dependent 6-phosphofructokinase [Chloroflexi bacterium]|nr:MAG: ATP-dependent 6-phosphofructokinase [Chloroflexota bacterium]